MAIAETKGVFLKGRLKKDGVTFYTRGGKVIMRSSISEQPHRRTRKQFISRQRMAHNVSLWKSLKEEGTPIFEGGQNRYGRFNTLMRKLPVVFMTKEQQQAGCALLMPEMPVSDGLLSNIEYSLGVVNSRPALLTSIPVGGNTSDILKALRGRNGYLKEGEQLWLYGMKQEVYEDALPWPLPKVSVRREVLNPYVRGGEQSFSGIELRAVGGHLALVGDAFADETRGWALVHVRGEHASSQQVVTRCRLFEQYTTDVALEHAADSYGGLTD